MLDDFIIRTFLFASLIVFITGPIGCFIIWKKLTLFTNTLAHSALIGICIGYLLGINLTFSVFVILSMIGIGLLKLQKTTLTVLMHASLPIGLIAMNDIRFDIYGLLFGDILAINNSDILSILISGVLILIILKMIWKPLFASIQNDETEETKINAIFTILIAAVIALSIKIVGILFVTGMLIIPAITAKNISDTPQKMVICSILCGMVSVCIGLLPTWEFDTLPGASIIVAALVVFCFSFIPKKI